MDTSWGCQIDYSGGADDNSSVGGIKPTGWMGGGVPVRSGSSAAPGAQLAVYGLPSLQVYNVHGLPVQGLGSWGWCVLAALSDRFVRSFLESSLDGLLPSFLTTSTGG